jgi:histidinol dehydrogenase
MNAIIINPSKSEWPEIIKRPSINSKNLDETVMEIINTVRQSGDVAVKEYSMRFHGFAVEKLWVTAEEIEASETDVDKDSKNFIEVRSKK